MQVRWAVCWVLACGMVLPFWAALSAPVLAEDAAAANKLTYDEHVQPILRQKCFSCHNTDKKSGGLDMTTYSNLMQGGGSGAVIEPGSAPDSYLYMLVTHESEPFMPPMSEKLPEEMLRTIAGWIDAGAPENAGSKPVVKKPMVDLASGSVSDQRPEGPPPMPPRLSLEPVRRTARPTATAALATSPWASLVAVGGQDQVLLYNSATLELLGVLPLPEGEPEVLRFSRNGRLLLAGGGHAGSMGRVVVWDVTTGQRVIEAGDELDAVLAADITSNHATVALGGPQRIVRAYNTADGQLRYELRKHTEWITAVSFSPDGVLLATADRNGGLIVWEAQTGREYLTLAGHSAAVTALSWRGDSNILASASEDGTIRLWEMENGGQVKNWGAHGGGVADLEMARDGRIVSCGRDQLAKLWDQNGSQLRAFEAFSDLALKVTICDETNRVIAGDWNGTIRVWNAADGAALGELTGNPPTLAERLQAATEQLAAIQNEQQTLAEAQQSEQAALAKLQQDLTTAQQNLPQAMQQSEAATSAVNATRQTLTDAMAALQATTATVAQWEPHLPALQQLAQKAQETAASLPQDSELAELAARLKARAERATAELETARQQVAQQQASAQQAQQQLAAAEKAASDATAAAQTAQQAVEQLNTAVTMAQQKVAAAQAALDGATTRLAEVQQQAARWRDEIAFAQSQQGSQE